MTLLGIDTSGKIASVAVCTENAVLSQTTVCTKLTHSQVILPICRNVLDSAGLELKDVDGIVCAMGPGSYTGLRIGIAAVKAMCFALEKPCLGISTLEALAYNFSGVKDTVVCSVMHARQDLVYNANFSLRDGQVTRECDDRIIPAEQVLKEISGRSAYVYFAGDYAEKMYYMEPQENNRFLAPPHLRLQLASSLCYAAFGKKFITPDELEAAYLQITKAEKDLEKTLD